MIRVGIIGATGYTGAELIRLLMSHNKADITTITSRQYKGDLFSDIYPSFRGIADIVIDDYNPDRIKEKCDVVFTALPHKVPMGIIPDLLDMGVRVVDLSADFRFISQERYEAYYCNHEAGGLIKTSVYGLTEIFTKEIKNAVLVGNPGCYPTCSLLGILPLIINKAVIGSDIIIDAKSGVSGAGRGLNQGTHFCEVDEGFKAYKVASHRHRPEIEEKVELFAGEPVNIAFTPHLIPAVRGMLSTVYMKSSVDIDEDGLRNILREFYKDNKFLRILPGDEMPNIKNVAGTNYCDINLKYDEKTGRIILVSAIDNLMKGASGQAVQNMNVMFGIDEAEGLSQIACPV